FLNDVELPFSNRKMWSRWPGSVISNSRFHRDPSFIGPVAHQIIPRSPNGRILVRRGSLERGMPSQMSSSSSDSGSKLRGPAQNSSRLN
ncbi:hypothetical protein AVEN_39968-1, partial [Araneus ventricosus]